MASCMRLCFNASPADADCCLDDFEVAIFLRESRTRHSLLTRHKAFDEPGDAPRATERQTRGLGTAGAEILVESDSDENISLRDIPQGTPSEGDPEPDDRRPSKRRKGKEPSSRPADPDPDPEEDKKLRFRTNYESFNIYGWVLCLLVTRKGDRARTQAAPSEPPRQALMEEWISTQAPGDVDEE